LTHPEQSSFFGTISISFVLLAAAAFHGRARSPTCSGRFGAALQAVLILVVFRNWIVHPIQFDHIHPGWFILMVGIVVTVGGWHWGSMSCPGLALQPASWPQ
jgi:tellurite resistance protein TehA-like permease